MNADTVNAIVQLTREADGTAGLAHEIQLPDGSKMTYRNSATEFGRELGDLMTAPQPSSLLVTTLTGLVDAVKAGAYDPNIFLVHVENYLTVALKERNVDTWGRRSTHITAKHQPMAAFTFDHYYDDPQRFIIGLQVSFLQTNELLYLIKVASNLKAGNTAQTNDDGFSQSLVIKTGEVTAVEAKIPPRIKLIPMRTFPEAAPIMSEYLIRFKQSAQQAPSIALFDCEGSKWQGDQMNSIKAWLLGQIDPAFPILA